MKKQDFIKKIAEKTGYSQVDIRGVLDGVKEVTFEGLRDGEEIPLIDSVKLRREHKEARQGRNPATGEPIEIAAKYVPRCKFGTSIKAFIA